MAFKNQNVRPAKANGVGAAGNPAPLANMPANNVGEHKVKLGSGKPSTFGNDVAGKGAARQGGVVAKTAQKANLPTHNKPITPLPLGTTKHGVGNVPSYLRGK